MTARTYETPAAGRDEPSPHLVAQLLAAVRDASEAMKNGDRARLAAAESRRRYLLRVLVSRTPLSGGGMASR